MPASKSQRIAGWVLTVLIAIFLIGPSAIIGKFIDWEGKEQMFQKMGFTFDLMFKIGILEVILAILLLIPTTTFVAAILLTGYLGGAVVTHLRVGEPIFMPIIMGVVMWIGLALRFPQIWSLSIGNSPARSTQEKTSN